VPTTPARIGRPPATSRDDIERAAIQLFLDVGFDATTVDDIAAAAGIGRRTFFRYFASKNDIVWGRFDEGLQRLEASLADAPPDRPVADVLREAVVRVNAFPAEQLDVHRQRMTLILTVQSLQAHSTLMYAAWRDVVASYVARRLDLQPDDLIPRLAGHVLLGAAVAAYEQWLSRRDVSLTDLLDEAVRHSTRVIPPAQPAADA
jgi:TetR/AcrR family transcriptional regulator, regulator of mycofactocin system